MPQVPCFEDQCHPCPGRQQAPDVSIIFVASQPSFNLILWSPQLVGVDVWTLRKRGDDVVDVVLVGQLEEEVAVDEENGDEDEDDCEADNSKQNEETFSSRGNLPWILFISWILVHGCDYAIFA